MDGITQALAVRLARLRLSIFPVGSHRERLYYRFLRPALCRILLSKEPMRGSGAPFWCEITSADGSRIETTSQDPYRFRAILKGDESVAFNICAAIDRLEVRGLALVFFMGLGDYIFSTPLLAELRRRCPTLPIHAYVSRNSDSNNSPLVGQLLNQDPNIDAVEYYDGKRSDLQALDWRNYDYRDVFNRVPEHFLTIPMIYDHQAGTRHRVFAHFDSFCWPRPSAVTLPILYLPSEPSRNVRDLLSVVMAAYRQRREGIIFLQLEARSSNYLYPHADQLAMQFVKLGYVVVSVTTLTIRDPALITINMKQFSITESIHLLKQLHDAVGDELTLVTITSVFGAVSAALNIKNLQMWHFYDPTAHVFWYPNVHLIAYKDDPAIPQGCITVAKRTDYWLNAVGQADYTLEFVIATFMALRTADRTERVAGGPDGCVQDRTDGRQVLLGTDLSFASEPSS